MKNINQILLSIVGIVVFIFFIYGCYWVVKTVSYGVFYEDMVKSTVIEMVNPEVLKSGAL